MIEVRDLNVSFGDFRLRDVNLELRAGGCLAILGPSGAGKTVLLETVMGARRPRSGRVLLDGREITDLPPEARRIAYIPQDLALFPHLSVRDNIVFGLPSRAARRDAGDEVARLAAMLRIEHLLERRRISTLSGGEQQRVALARALIVQPRVLFLDEPFASLDAATAGDLLRSFRVMRRELGTTVFMVTHDLDEASVLADDVAIMMAGRIVESGSRVDVLRQPRTVPVARFLNIRNVLAVESIPSIPSLARSIANAEPGQMHVAIRAEDITVHPRADRARDLLPARLDGLIPVGAHVIAELTVDGTCRLEAVVGYSEAAALERCLGADVGVRIDPDRIIFLLDAEPAPRGR